MYRTTNSDYGQAYNTRSSSQRQPQPQPQSQDARFGFNAGQSMNSHQNYNQSYYGNGSYGANIGSYAHSDYTNSKANSQQPQFNVGVQSSKQTRPYSVSGYSMTEPTSTGLPNIGNTCYM